MSGVTFAQDRRLKEERTEIGPYLTAGQDGGAFSDRIFDVLTGLVQLILGNQRPDIDRVIQRGAEAQGGCPTHERVHEGVEDAGLHVKPFERNAQLTRIGEAPLNCTVHGSAEVCIIEHEHRILPAQLQRALGQLLSRLASHDPTRLGAPRETDEVGGRDQWCADVPPAAGQHLEESTRQAGLTKELHRVERARKG